MCSEEIRSVELLLVKVLRVGLKHSFSTINEPSGRHHAEQALFYPHGYSSAFLKAFDKRMVQQLL